MPFWEAARQTAMRSAHGFRRGLRGLRGLSQSFAMFLADKNTPDELGSPRTPPQSPSGEASPPIRVPP